jgi:hypothetical protein
MRRKVRRTMQIFLGIVAITLTVAVVGCLGVSNGTWYVKSAPVPEGWPMLTPVGEVEVKAYPAYRAAVAGDAPSSKRDRGALFMTLFEHIKENDIAMTAPVEMGHSTTEKTPRVRSMAFLYRRPSQGEAGPAGAVRVVDSAPRNFAGTGVRGDYNQTNFERGLQAVRAWLDRSTEWRADGPPRYLGYNGPFVPRFARYGEVQIPVKQVGANIEPEH